MRLVRAQSTSLWGDAAGLRDNIATAEGIALSDFYAWNPAVKDDCSGLEAEYYICVGIS